VDMELNSLLLKCKRAEPSLMSNLFSSFTKFDGTLMGRIGIIWRSGTLFDDAIHMRIVETISYLCVIFKMPI